MHTGTRTGVHQLDMRGAAGWQVPALPQRSAHRALLPDSRKEPCASLPHACRLPWFENSAGIGATGSMEHSAGALLHAGSGPHTTLRQADGSQSKELIRGAAHHLAIPAIAMPMAVRSFEAGSISPGSSTARMAAFSSLPTTGSSKLLDSGAQCLFMWCFSRTAAICLSPVASSCAAGHTLMC